MLDAASLNGFNVGGFMLLVCSVANYTSKELVATHFKFQVVKLNY